MSIGEITTTPSARSAGGMQTNSLFILLLAQREELEAANDSVQQMNTQIRSLNDELADNPHNAASIKEKLDSCTSKLQQLTRKVLQIKDKMETEEQRIQQEQRSGTLGNSVGQAKIGNLLHTIEASSKSLEDLVRKCESACAMKNAIEANEKLAEDDRHNRSLTKAEIQDDEIFYHVEPHGESSLGDKGNDRLFCETEDYQ